MKLPLISAVAAVTIALSATAMAAESTNKESVSGAPDSTVMTQTKSVKAEKAQHKQVQSEENKRGRPAAKSSAASN